MNAPVRHLGGVIAAVLVVAISATGCGSTSKGAAGAAAPTTTPATTMAATTTAAAATSGSPTSAAATSSPTATSAAAPTSVASVPPAAASSALAAALTAAAQTTVKATGGGSFCKNLADGMNAAMKSATASTSDSLKKTMQTSLAEVEKLMLQAPSDIKTDLTTLVTAVSGFEAALAKANYDYTKVPPSALTGMETPQVQAAETRVDAWVKAHCGIDMASG